MIHHVTNADTPAPVAPPSNAHSDALVPFPPTTYQPAEPARYYGQPNITTERRELFVGGETVIVPVPMGEHLVAVARAPAGSKAQPEGNTFTPDICGAYVLGVVTMHDRHFYKFVVVAPEHLETPGLGRARLTLRSIANHPESGMTDERWDALSSSEHANPFYGVTLNSFGGEFVQPSINGGDPPPPRPKTSWASVAARRNG